MAYIKVGESRGLWFRPSQGRTLCEWCILWENEDGQRRQNIEWRDGEDTSPGYLLSREAIETAHRTAG